MSPLTDSFQSLQRTCDERSVDRWVIEFIHCRGRDLSFFCALQDHLCAPGSVVNEMTNRFDESDAIPVIWDGDIAVVVRKPAGLFTEAAPDIDSLQQRLRHQFSSRTAYIAMVHRLDRPVSGLLLVATAKRAARLLAAQFASQKIVKTYLAVLPGRLAGHSEVWIDRIAKRDGESRVDIAEVGAAGKQAETEVEFVRYDARRDRTLVRFRPKTGRTHQLRIQASTRGFPILGDLLYGGETDTKLRSERIALHAESLTFFDPRNGVPVTVHDPSNELPSFLGSIDPACRL